MKNPALRLPIILCLTVCNFLLWSQHPQDILSSFGKVTGSLKTRTLMETDALVTLYKDNIYSEEIYGHAFQFNPTPSKCSICPRKNTHHLNGITTLDIVKIQRHILGLTPFSNPYMFVAADVNLSKSITAADLSEIRRLILGIITQFSKVQSWVFIPQDTTFGTTLPDAGFFGNYCKQFQMDLNTLVNVDFVAVKMGDVSENANGKDSLVNSTQRLQDGRIQYENHELSNELFRTDFKIHEQQIPLGFQFCLQFDANDWEFAGLQNGVIQINESQFSLHESLNGKIFFAWDQYTSPIVENTNALFSIIWKKKDPRATLPVLQFSTTGIDALMIDTELNEIKLQLVPLSSNAVSSMQLYQDFYNQQIIVESNLTEDTNREYCIMDLSGRIIKKNTLQLLKGKNRIAVSTTYPGANGIYFFRIYGGYDEKFLKFAISD